jgi:HSP20 family protein
MLEIEVTMPYTAIVELPAPTPWTDLDTVWDELRSHFFDSFGFLPFPNASKEAAKELGPRRPRTDIQDTGTAYKIVAEVPGIPKDRLEIRVNGSQVEIRAESETTAESKDQPFVHRERSYRGFYRSFELPEPVVGSEAKAHLDQGVLELSLPKRSPTPSPEEVKVAVQ